MIAIDGTPLVLEPRRGVATALRMLLEGFRREPPGEPVRLFSPEGRSARAFRRVLPRLLEESGATVLYSPWSAFPRVGIPVVCVVHELPFVRLGPIEGRIRTWVHRRWLARNLAECAAVIVPSFATRDDVLALSACSGGKVHVIPHGFDPEPWAKAPRRAAARPYVAMLGTGGGRRGRWKKGVDVLLSAMQRMPGVVLRLIDDAEDDDVRSAVAGALLLAYPSRSEGFGFPPLEAMAAGVPVVASDITAVREVTGDAALLVPAGDSAALATAIQRVASDEALRARLIAVGHERAQAFPPERTARQVAEVLRRARGIS